MIFQRKHWWTLVSFWPDELEKVGQTGKYVFGKRNVKPQTSYHINVLMFILVSLLCLKYILYLFYFHLFIYFFLYTTPRHFYILCTPCFIHSSLSFNYIGSHSSLFIYKTFQVNLDFNSDRGDRNSICIIAFR